MECLTEFTCSVFVDGEMPEHELRQVEEHLESCAPCRTMAAAFREESRVLLNCIQEIDMAQLEQTPLQQRMAAPVSPPVRNAPGAAELAPAATRRDVVKFGGWILGLATLLQLAMASPENFVPASGGLDWLDPSNLSGGLNWLSGAIVFFASEGVSAMMSLVTSLSVVMLYGLILAGAVMLVRRSAGKSAMVGILATLGTILLIVGSAPPSYAMDVRNGGRDKLMTIPEEETIDDSLFITGDTIFINGTVNGDVIAFARQVTINGDVKGNLLTGAQSINIQGTVEGTVVAAGQTVQLSGRVMRNMVGFSQSFTIAKNANVGGDAAGFGNELHLNGSLARNFYAFGIADIAGSVGRNVVFRGGTISVLPSARIGGDLTTHVEKAESVHIDAGATIGGRQTMDITKPIPGTSNKYRTFRFYFSQMLHIAAAFIAGMILLLLFPGLRRTSFSEIGSTLVSGGVGFLALVATPIAAVIAAITLIGLPVAIAGFMAWLLGLYLAKIIVANFVGRALLSAGGDRLPALALNLFVGLMLVFIIINLPYIGGLIHFLFVLIGLGGLVMSIYGSYHAEHDFGK